MDIIVERANHLVKFMFRGQNLPEYDDLKKRATTQLYDIDDKLDKIKFLQVLLQANEDTFKRHKCSNAACGEPMKHGNISYYLKQEITRLGVIIDDNSFTFEEKRTYEDKIDELVKHVEELKMQNEILYEDFLKEIEELKQLFFLGKKSWHQILLGKTMEMVAGGIISETLSKEIIGAFTDITTKLIQ